jgi:membrane associated rhomboid family serine protease
MTSADLLHLHDLLHRHIGPGFHLVLAMLAVELLNLVAFRKLNGLGIVPRTAAGLPCIATAPFLHGDLKHFFANFLPLCVLAFLLGQLLPASFWWITAAIALGTGLLVWLLARRLNHLGMSGVVYGLFGFLTLHGFLAGNDLYLFMSVGLLVLYSGILWGALPTTAKTSWESHLAGLAVGLGVAWVQAKGLPLSLG